MTKVEAVETPHSPDDGAISPAMRARALKMAQRSAPYTLFAVIFTIVGLCALQSLRVLRFIYRPVLGLMRFHKVAAALPTFALVFCQVSAIALSLDATKAFFAESVTNAALICALWGAVLVGTMLAVLQLNRAPLNLSQIDAMVQHGWPERWFAARLRNPSDAYFVRFVIYGLITMVPAWTVLFMAEFAYPMGLIFFAASYFGNALKHENLDHTHLHNRLFQPKMGVSRPVRWFLSAFNFYYDYIHNPMCLRIPFFYNIQHVYVHHVENNGPFDTQSTVVYDRKSFVDFCKFTLEFCIDFSTGLRTVEYLYARKRFTQLKTLLRGIGWWYAIIALLFLVDYQIALFVVVFKFVATLAAGPDIYSWHGFADPDDPNNVYLNSINIVVLDEHGNLGASYHIEHHLRPGLHWSKIAPFGREQKRRHEENEALEWYYGGGYYSGATIVKALWLNKLECFIPLFSGYSDKIKDREQLLEIIERRSRPMVAVPRSAGYRRIDGWLGRMAGKYLIPTPLPPSDFQVDPPEWQLKRSAASIA